MHRRRIWSEELPYETLCSRPVLELCSRHGLEVLVAVRPENERRLPNVLARAADAGVTMALWPMLDDVSGRWANCSNAAVFAAFVERVVARAESAGPIRLEV